MGRQQKLKELRRQERLAPPANRPKRATVLTSAVLLAIFIIGALWWRGRKTENPTVSPSASPVALASMKETQTVRMVTAKGDIVLELYPRVAPKTADNFVKLASSGLYDGTKFHRVIKDFMIQGGDPNSKDNDPANDGQGGPGYEFEDEINPKSLGLSDAEIKGLEQQGYHYTYDLQSLPVDAGYIAMANRGPATNGSQFFIVTYTPQKHLYGKHTVFGKVIEGMDVVRAIDQGDELKKVVVEEAAGTPGVSVESVPGVPGLQFKLDDVETKE